MVLILKFKTLDMVLSAYDVVQCQNLGYYTIMFIYGAYETSLCPLDTTEVMKRETLSCDQDMMAILSLAH